LQSALTNNPKNLNYFLSYFNIKEGLKLSTFNDLFKVEDSKKIKLLEYLETDLKPKLKSRVLSRLQLVLSSGDQFEKYFHAYFLNNVKQNIPSIFSGVKFIYSYQKDKIAIIEKLISAHLQSIEKNNHLNLELCNNEKLDITPQLIWVYYYAACITIT
jgi:hypothetical protein